MLRLLSTQRRLGPLDESVVVSELRTADAVPVSCVDSAVPRIDRWVQVAGLVEKYESFADLRRSISVAEVGSQLAASSSKRIAAKQWPEIA